ncbi:methylated-DNA--[protein]-cysteine S-methyltransferase [Corynebacterium macclintockiae]|uniref:methylated-DNA--[protein]-cysteine S-methyltransferase n=1 Tax=Corynebacterium macclintockiae TaxID=2913501 RepID=UPI003EC4BE5E
MGVAMEETFTVLATDRGVRRIGFPGEDWGAGESPVGESPAGERTVGDQARRHVAEVEKQLEEYLAGQRQVFTVPVDLVDVTTPFRRRVLQALAQIPYGQTITYAQLAEAAGNPRAVRAVASACASNPLPILYPCHRVIRSDGSFGEYRGGRELKATLLEMERGGAGD